MQEKPEDLIESFSGIRGIAGKGITEDLAYKYAFYFCQLFAQPTDTLIITGDTRPSTPALKQTILKAFSDFGIKKVIDLGVAPVQTAEYSIPHFKAKGGVYITASHNEPEYNGWKFLKEDGAILYAEQAEKLISQVNNSNTQGLTSSNINNSTEIIDKHQEATDAYIEYVLQKINQESVNKLKNSNFKILLDPNGGSSIEILEKLLPQLGVRAEIINKNPGEFARMVEPKEESLLPLADKMAGNDFNFAAGFDCDADRMEIVLPPNSQFAKKMKTTLVSGQYVLALACDALLENTKNQVVVTNDATSCLIRDVIKKHKAVAIEVEVGETIIVEEMEKQNSIIGGEGSNGGVIIPPIKCRDGIMTIALILKMMAERAKSLDAILMSYPEYFSKHSKIACSPAKAPIIRGNIEKYFQDKGWVIKKTGDETGGLRVFPDNNSFIFFRQSKTEPGAFRIYSESDQSQEKANQLLDQGIAAFEKFNN